MGLKKFKDDLNCNILGTGTIRQETTIECKNIDEMITKEKDCDVSNKDFNLIGVNSRDAIKSLRWDKDRYHPAII